MTFELEIVFPDRKKIKDIEVGQYFTPCAREEYYLRIDAERAVFLNTGEIISLLKFENLSVYSCRAKLV